VSPDFNQEELTFPLRDINSSSEIKQPPIEHFWGSSMKVTYVSSPLADAGGIA
jgi:hypothetical protein